jgi:hypothetical protein
MSMVDPVMFLIWTGLGVLVGWVTGQFLFGYRLVDDLIGGVFGSIIGGAVAHALFGDALGGPLGPIIFGVALSVTLVLVLRILPRHTLT